MFWGDPTRETDFQPLRTLEGETIGEETRIGAAYERDDGNEKATGLALYGPDVVAPRMIYAKILRSPHPHAKILHLNADRAKRVHGVRAVVSGSDFPNARWGTRLEDRPIYAVDRVRFVGEPVAGVAAVDEDTAQEALSLIQVEYEELPAVFDMEKSAAPEASLIHPDLGNYKHQSRIFNPIPGTNICNRFEFSLGDIDEGFQRSDFVYEDTYHVPMVQHCPMEPHACIARFSPKGQLIIWTTTQGLYLTREQVAQAVGLPHNDVRVVCTCVGGAFGGKISAVVETLAGALALNSNHLPVRLELTREEEFVGTFVRQPFRATYKTGVMKNGDLVAREVRSLWDTGAYGEYEIAVSRYAGFCSGGPYRIPNVRVESTCVYTNNPVAGAFRGFGVPETCFGYEAQFDRIARDLGVDPIELRLRNGLEDGDLSTTGETVHAVGLKECIRKATEPLDRKGRGTSSAKRRGWGIACMWKFSVPTAHVVSTIEINADGSAVLNTAAVEHGQGAHTILRQIAAEALGLDAGLISVSPQDTSTSPYGWETSSSKTTFFDGNSILLAAQDAKAQLFRAAAVLLEAAPEDLDTKNGRIFPRGSPDRSVGFGDVAMGVFKPDGGFVGGPVLGRGHYTPLPASPASGEAGMGRKSASFWMYAAQGAEVEVDEETGEVRLLKLTAAHDVGKAMNPNGCEGQIEGALGQGLGTALHEEMRLEQGVVLNPTFMDYKIPCMLDVPSLFPRIVEEQHPEGPYGAKGVGEPGLAPTAPAIANAVYDAIGVQINALPLTPERVLEAIRKRDSGE